MEIGASTDGSRNCRGANPAGSVGEPKRSNNQLDRSASSCEGVAHVGQGTGFAKLHLEEAKSILNKVLDKRTAG